MIGFVGIQYSDAFFEDGIVIEVPGQIMNMSQNVISSGETMFVDGSFKQPVDDFTANIFKDYEYSSKLVLTLSPSSNEFGDFNFNFTIPQDWELGNYHIVLENGLQFMDWEFDVRKNYSVVTLDRTVYPVPWDLSPLKQFKSGISLDDIQCKNNLVLIQKHDGSPVCVTSETKQKLIERGWTKINNSQIRNPVSVPVPADPMSITINGSSTSLVIPINTGETKEIDILLEPKTPIVSSTVSVESYFGSAGDCNEIDTASYCPGRGIDMMLSDTSITSQKEITLTIKVPANTTSGTYAYLIKTSTIFESSSSGELRTVGNSIRFDIRVENENPNTLPPFPQIESLRPEDRLQVRHSAGYTTVEVTLSSWKEYDKWEESRGAEHDPMPPIPINESNINPIVFDLLYEMWQFKDYGVSKYDKSLFVKTIQKDYGVQNHHGIKDWLKTEHDKVFGESNAGYSSHFEFRDKVYQVTMVAAD